MKWYGGKILPLFVYCIMEGGIGIMDGRCILGISKPESGIKHP